MLNELDTLVNENEGGTVLLDDLFGLVKTAEKFEDGVDGLGEVRLNELDMSVYELEAGVVFLGSVGELERAMDELEVGDDESRAMVLDVSLVPFEIDAVTLDGMLEVNPIDKPVEKTFD